MGNLMGTLIADTEWIETTFVKSQPLEMSPPVEQEAYPTQPALSPSAYKSQLWGPLLFYDLLHPTL